MWAAESGAGAWSLFSREVQSPSALINDFDEGQDRRWRKGGREGGSSSPRLKGRGGDGGGGGGFLCALFRAEVLTEGP